MLERIYSSDHYQIRVSQGIGGELLCNVSVEYGMSANYYVGFSLFHVSGEKEYLGEGSYRSNVVWDERPQIQVVSEAFVLVVGDVGRDKLLVREKNNRWVEFTFRDDQIYGEKLWKDRYSMEFKGYHGNTASVYELADDEIHVLYRFVIDRESAPQVFDEKRLIYRLYRESDKVSLTLADIL